MDLLDVAVLHFEGIFFSVRSLRVVERLDLKNVSVLMVDFSVLCCLSVAARRAGREVTARRWLWYA